MPKYENVTYFAPLSINGFLTQSALFTLKFRSNYTLRTPPLPRPLKMLHKDTQLNRRPAPTLVTRATLRLVGNFAQS